MREILLEILKKRMLFSDFFLTLSHQRKKSTGRLPVKVSLTWLTATWISWTLYYSGEWVLVLQIWPQHKASDIRVGWKKFTKIIQSAECQIENRDNVDCFFNTRGNCGIIHREFVPPLLMVNAVFSKGVMERLLARICRIHRIRPHFRESGDWFLLHDNVLLPHSSILVIQYLAKRKVVCIDHSPCLPDLTLPDYFLFPKLRIPMKGHCFSSVEEIQTRGTVLKTIPKEEFFCDFQRLYERFQHCIAIIFSRESKINHLRMKLLP